MIREQRKIEADCDRKGDDQDSAEQQIPSTTADAGTESETTSSGKEDDGPENSPISSSDGDEATDTESRKRDECIEISRRRQDTGSADGEPYGQEKDRQVEQYRP